MPTRTRLQRTVPVLCLALVFLSPFLHSRHTRAAPRIPSVYIGQVAYLSLEDLAGALGGRLYVHAPKQKTELRLNRHTLVFTLLSSVLVIDDITYRMPVETRLHGGVLHVPAAPVAGHIERLLSVPLTLQTRDPGTPVAAPPPAPQYNLLGITVESGPGHTRLFVRTDGSISRERIRHLPDAGGASLLIQDVVPAPGALRPPDPSGYIRNLSVARPENAVRIDVQLAVPTLRQSLDVGEDHIALTLEPIPQAQADRTRWTVSTIIIDPGHGGKDPGAIGPGGTREKEIVLQVGERLQALLKKHLPGVNILLTRHDDTFIPLRKRSQIAIRNGGKLFISLHCNASKNRQSNGAEIYFLSDAKTADAAEVARRENAVTEYEENGHGAAYDDELESIAYGLRSTQFLKESQDLAALIRAEVAGTIARLEDRGVKQANFYVMRGTMGEMPSVLVEMGFISNPTEEKRLRTAAFQKAVAEAICQGVKAFKTRYEQQLSQGQ